MKYRKNSPFFSVIFNIILLSSLIEVMNSLSFFPLEKVKEEETPSNDTLLIFSIKGAVDSSVSQNISFSIETEIYSDKKLLSKENYINCRIPATPNAKFGTQIIAKCEFNLMDTPTADTILFSKFISEQKIIKIDDQNKYILNKKFSFSKKINITVDFEYEVENIKSINCNKDEYTFGIIGEMNKIFISSFKFNFTINPSSFINAKCESPNIYFTKKTMINCTIELSKDDKNFVENLNKGIVIKGKYYKVINDEEEKILKIKIKKNLEKIELKDLSCKEDNQVINKENNITEKQEEKLENKEKNIANDDKGKEEKKIEIEDNMNISISKLNKSEDINENNITKTEKKEKDKKESNITIEDNKINNITEQINKEKNNTEKETTKVDNINDKKLYLTKENITDKIEEKEIKNKTTENETFSQERENIDLEQERIKALLKNIEKNNSLINTTNNVTIEKEKTNKTLEKNESISLQKNNISEETNITEEKETNITKNNSLKMNQHNNTLNESTLENNTTNNISDNNQNNLHFEKYIKKSNRTYNNEKNENNKNTTTAIETDNITEKIQERDIRGDYYAQIWRGFGNRGNTMNRNRTEIEREEQRGREWERQKEEERKKKEEEEERKKEEARKRREQEDLFKMMKEREEKERNEKAEKERKENEERQRRENERLENIRRENLRNRDKQNQNNENNNNGLLNQKNIDVKLIHENIKFKFGTLYYRLYALTPVPKGHQIKINLSLSKFNFMTREETTEEKSLILKSEEEISKEDKNIIIEYKAYLDCKDCRKIILNKSGIEGATIYNIPEENNLRDAALVNKNNYLSKNRMKSPLLYITEDISNKNCNINLEGNFFNRNKFFASKLNLLLISTDNKNNVTISCQLNDRSIFSCSFSENLKNYNFKLEQFIIDQKENIIFDNSLITKNNKIYTVSCEKENNKFKVEGNKTKNSKKDDKIEGPKKSKKKKIIISIILIIILLYLIIDCCCCYEKEPEYQYSSSSRGNYSNRNYVGETSGLINRRW